MTEIYFDEELDCGEGTETETMGMELYQSRMISRFLLLASLEEPGAQ